MYEGVYISQETGYKMSTFFNLFSCNVHVMYINIVPTLVNNLRNILTCHVCMSCM